MSASERISAIGRDANNPYGEYRKATWQDGDVIDQEGLNIIEDGIYYIDREIREARGSEGSLREKIDSIDTTDKVDKMQGLDKIGYFMIVGNNGEVIPINGGIRSDALQSLTDIQKATARINIAAADATTVQELGWRVDDLAYVPIEILTLNFTSPSNGIAERGSTVNTITLEWTFKGNPATLTLNSSSITPPTTTSRTLTNLNLRNDTTFRLVATDTGSHSYQGRQSTKEVKLNFYNNIYYGVATIPATLNSSFITGLGNKILSNTKSRTFTVTANSGQYVWYALPTRIGTVSFNVGGFDGGFEPVQTVRNVTNASGYTEDYYIYRSTNASLGNTTIIVK